VLPFECWQARHDFRIKNCQPHTQPAGFLAYMTALPFLKLFVFYLSQNEAFAHTQSRVTHPQLCILVPDITMGSENNVISRLVKQPSDDAMIALVLLTSSQLRVDALTPSSRARAPFPSEVSDPFTR
jgi:hypothetical protein